MKRFFYILILIYLHSLGGCKCEEDDHEDSQNDKNPSSPVVTQNPSRVTPWDPVLNKSRGAFLLTPEQFSQQLAISLDYKAGWTLDNGQFVNVITDFLAVPLGGVDFSTKSIRDRNPKVQTQLIIRQLAWQTAMEVVWRDVNPNNPEESKVFSIADMENPDPTQQEWIDQLNHLYWRLYSREPTASEVSRCQQAYRDSVHAWSEWPPAGWIVITYAMLASTEMWNL